MLMLMLMLIDMDTDDSPTSFVSTVARADQSPGQHLVIAE
jgi:hypothetical protein